MVRLSLRLALFGTAVISVAAACIEMDVVGTGSTLPVASLNVSPATWSLPGGGTKQYSAAVFDSVGNALSGRTIAWSSSDEAIATISVTGLATAKSVGTVTITATSEGKSQSASLTVTSSTTPPPVSIDEPLFDAGRHRELFHDGFEAYASTAQLLTWEGLFPKRWLNRGAEDIALTTTGAVVGSKAVRFTYPISEQIGRLLEAVVTTPEDPREVILTWWVRTEPGYEWFTGVGVGGQAHKMFVTNIGGAGAGNRILLQFAKDGIAPEDLKACVPNMAGAHTPTWSIGGALYKQNRNYPAWHIAAQGNDGEWHRYTTRLVKSTVRPDLDHGNGRLEMWADGVKIMEYFGDDPSRCEYGKVNIPTVKLVGDLHFPSVNGGSTRRQWLEYDDVRVWTP